MSTSCRTGLLAHSHIWSPSTATRHVTEALDLGLEVNHPRDVLDITCVADLGTWDVTRMSYMGPGWNSWHLDPLREAFPDGYASCTVFGPDPETFAKTQNQSPAIPVAQLCAYLTHRLAWEDPSMRPMADYFAVVGMFGSGKGLGRPWPLDAVFSADVVQAMRAGRIDQEAWSHWHHHFG